MKHGHVKKKQRGVFLIETVIGIWIFFVILVFTFTVSVWMIMKYIQTDALSKGIMNAALNPVKYINGVQTNSHRVKIKDTVDFRLNGSKTPPPFTITLFDVKYYKKGQTTTSDPTVLLEKGDYVCVTMEATGPMFSSIVQLGKLSGRSCAALENDSIIEY